MNNKAAPTKIFGAMLGLLFILFSCKAGNPTSASKSDSLSTKKVGLNILYHGEAYHIESNQLTPVDLTLVAEDRDRPLLKPNPAMDDTSPSDQVYALSGAKPAYVTKCQDKSVPIPPVWPDKWTKKGNIPQQFIMGIQSKGYTSVWSFDNKLGTCAALARTLGQTANSTVQLFGVICSSKTTGATCFWDNVDPESGIKVSPKPSGFDITTQGTGADKLAENCTECHRGSQPWIRVSGTASAQLQDMPVKWKPFGQKEWLNSPGATHIDGCSDCHAMPKMNSSYCALARTLVTWRLMPPADMESDRDKMTAALNRACSGY